MASGIHVGKSQLSGSDIFSQSLILKIFNDDVERNKTKVMSLITKKHGFLCRVLFPIKASVLFMGINVDKSLVQ